MTLAVSIPSAETFTSSCRRGVGFYSSRLVETMLRGQIAEGLHLRVGPRLILAQLVRQQYDRRGSRRGSLLLTPINIDRIAEQP